MGRPKYSNADFLAAALAIAAEHGLAAVTCAAAAERLRSFFHRFSSRSILLGALWLQTVSTSNGGSKRRWTPATPYDAALAAVLLFTVTSRVISPQYMIWLLGVAAVCLTSRHTVQRPVAVLILLATAISAVAYPTLYAEVRGCSWTGCGLMLARNGLLAAAAVLSFVRLWRSTVAPPPEQPRTPRVSPDARGVTPPVHA